MRDADSKVEIGSREAGALQAAATGRAVEFVKSLEIEVLGSGRIWRSGDAAALGEVQPQPPSAYVVAAAVVAFADGIAKQQKEDLLNSTLLAQLAANRRCDRERDTLNWYECYRSVLAQVGWKNERRLPGIRTGGAAPARPVLPVQPTPQARPSLPPRLSGLPFERVIGDRPRFTADTAVLNVLRKEVSDGAFAATQTALNVLRGLSDRDRRVVIFESSSHSSERGNFQIVSVSCGPDRVLRMTVAAVFFSTNEGVSRVMTFNFAKNSTQMFQARDTMTLNAADYDTVREQVIQQLGDQASAYIDEIYIA